MNFFKSQITFFLSFIIAITAYSQTSTLKQRVDNAQSLSDEAKSKYREVTDYTGMANFWN